MERGFERIASPDPFDESSPWFDNNSDAEDASPASSNFSSCEGSEFERYCSANSVLGTASVCSSVGNQSEFLDSFRSFGNGEDAVSESSSIRERFGRNRTGGNIASSGRFGCFSDGGGESPRENGVTENKVSLGGSVVLPRIRTGSSLFTGSNEDGGKNINLSGLDVENGGHHLQALMLSNFGNELESFPFPTKNVASNNDFCWQGSTSGVHDPIGPVADEGSSSRCEDSSLGGGTDDEDRIRLYQKSNLQHLKAAQPKKGNPLLISSSVAFGNDDWDDFMQETEGNGLDCLSLYRGEPTKHQQNHIERKEKTLGTPHSTLMVHSDATMVERMEQEADKRNVPLGRFPVPDVVETTGSATDCPIRNPLIENKSVSAQKPITSVYSAEGSYSAPAGVKNKDRAAKMELQIEETSNVDICEASDRPLSGKSKRSGDSSSQFYPVPTKAFQGKEAETVEGEKLISVLPKNWRGHDYTDMGEKSTATNKVEKLDANESYEEMVLEMEEILLDSGEAHGAWFTPGNRGYISQRSHHFRDGSSTASTSGTDDVYLGTQYPPGIDWIEVVGAKQKKGDASFGERLVGVKEYTVYKLRVWSGKDQWEVERRYRDFFTLYRQLKTLFTYHGLTLPSPWSNVQRESRKIFGNASPNVISERSTLIQDCLRSILHFRSPFGTPSSLVWFLSPSKDLCNSGSLKTLAPHSLQKLPDDVNSNSSHCGDSCVEDVSTLGKTISLVVEIKVRKSIRQLLEAQCYTCAGCHRRLDAGKTLMQELVQTLGWGKPRLCEYTGQLFCSTCHTNDTAVLPARVLHQWDFSLYPVSQLAKAYLESIYEQPMLCVSAVNPFLLSKVPSLLLVMGIRKKIVSMLPYVRCPFRRSIQRGLGSRRYLLESNEFFALRDLVDLSKGVFAALPVLVDTISSKILDHIAQQCLVCYDSGVPCAARQACGDPSSLIFPFQEAEATRCSSCDSVYHKPCIGKLGGCPCGKLVTVDGRIGPVEGASGGADIELDGFVDTPVQKSDTKTTAGFFSDFLSKATPEKLWKPRKSNPVILMGSLPSTSL